MPPGLLVVGKTFSRSSWQKERSLYACFRHTERILNSSALTPLYISFRPLTTPFTRTGKNPHPERYLKNGVLYTHFKYLLRKLLKF